MPCCCLEGDGPPSTQRQEAERMCAALRHAFEATDREILVRCRLEGNKSGATGVAVVRVGELLLHIALRCC